MDDDNRDYTVPALKKGLQILEMFTRERPLLTIGDFARHLDVTASAIYRTVVTLTEMGYLNKSGRNTYELGSMVLSRGFCYLASRDILNTAATHVDGLRDETSASCHLAIREGLEAVYVYRAVSPQVMMVNVPVGARFACHQVAIGRALLCGLDDDQIRHLYSGVALDGHDQGTIHSLPQLVSMISAIRKTGVSISGSDYSTALAAPVNDYSGQVVAAVNVSVPDFIIDTPGIRDHLTACLLRTAAAVSADMGWPGSA